MDGDGMPPPPPGGDPEMVGEPGGPEFGPAEGPPPGEPDGPPPGADMDGDGMPPPPPGEGEYDPEYANTAGDDMGAPADGGGYDATTMADGAPGAGPDPLFGEDGPAGGPPEGEPGGPPPGEMGGEPEFGPGTPPPDMGPDQMGPDPMAGEMAEMDAGTAGPMPTSMPQDTDAMDADADAAAAGEADPGGQEGPDDPGADTV